VGTRGAPQEAPGARQRQPRQAMPEAPGMPGQPRQILAMAVKAQVTAAPVSCPLPAAREGLSRAIARCRARYRIRPAPVAGIGRDAVRAPAADAGRRQARAAGHLAGVPGRRLLPAAQPASLRARRQATMTSMRPPRARGGGRQPALPAGQQPAPGALATGHGGHAARRPGERQGLAAGPAAPRAQTPDVAGPLRRRRPGLPAVSRLSGPERQVVPSRHRRRSRSPWCSLMPMSGPDIPVLCGRRSRGPTEGN